jgi:hypothetical protein
MERSATMRLDPVEAVSQSRKKPQNHKTSPELPASNSRLAAPPAAINLTDKALVAVIIAQVEALVVVQVGDLELDLSSVALRVVLGLRAHGLLLAGGVVAGEHTAVVPAGVVGPALRFFFARVAVAYDEAASTGDFGV